MAPPTLTPARHRALILMFGLSPLAALAQQSLPTPPDTAATAPRPAASRPLRAPVLPAVVLPTTAEPEGDISGGALMNPFGSAPTTATTTGQTLTAPVTLNAKTSADALTVTQTSSGRAINATANNSASAMSAVRGASNGKGSGVNGVHSGTGGQAGKFEIINAASAQPSLLVTTTGLGAGVQAIVKNTGTTDAPAVVGQHDGTSGYGVGVQGLGGAIGVRGNSGGRGVVGIANQNYGYGVSGQAVLRGVGVDGYSPNGVGVQGRTDTGYGLFGASTAYVGIYGTSNTSVGIWGHSGSNHGVAGYSDAGGNGVYGQSVSGPGVHGESGSSAGVYGHSPTKDGVYGESDSGFAIHGLSTGGGYAGYFAGPVRITGFLYALGGIGYASDRELKQDVTALDLGDVLARVAALPVTAWDYKAKPDERHIGPMAQDFHAAFGLGTDDKHIDVIDGIGVSLAAIKALQQQVEDKAARIELLETQLQALRHAVDGRLAALEQSATVSAATTASAAAGR